MTTNPNFDTLRRPVDLDELGCCGAAWMMGFRAAHKTGKLTPVARLEPVVLAQTTVSRGSHRRVQPCPTAVVLRSCGALEADRRSRSGPMRLVLALLLAGCGSTLFGFELPEGYCRPADHDRRPWEARHYAMTVPDDAPRRGSARPRVVIQVFSDFQCPFCARAVPTLERVLEEYGGCVQVVWRQRPLSYHEHARLAAIASHEVYLQSGDEAFWRFHDLLFENQEHIARADLLRYAEALGVDMEAFTRALDSEAHAAIIERDRAAIVALPGELDLGTPSFFVNGTLLHGARSYRQLAYRIEEALADDYASEGSN